MYGEFVRERITRLRILKGVSEYQMSYDLGHSRGYINNISSGKVLPSMNEFFAICDYFGITPKEFFDEKTENPKAMQHILSQIEDLNNDDSLLVLNIINRLNKK